MDSIKESIQKFFKSKAIGYYMVAGVLLYAIILAIVFFSTYNNPNISSINGSHIMGNKAESYVVETIGVFIIAGAVVELVVLAMPEFRFFHLGAIIMFGLALYKDVLIMGDFFAALGTGVYYNGGNPALNYFYFISLVVIEIVAIVAAFIGFVKEVDDFDEEEEEQ